MKLHPPWSSVVIKSELKSMNKMSFMQQEVSLTSIFSFYNHFRFQNHHHLKLQLQKNSEGSFGCSKNNHFSQITRVVIKKWKVINHLELELHDRDQDQKTKYKNSYMFLYIKIS